MSNEIPEVVLLQSGQLNWLEIILMLPYCSL